LEARLTEEFRSIPKLAELWAGLLVGPMAALIQLEINYALVLWACATGRVWGLHLVSLLALLLTVFTGVLSYRNWRRMRNRGEVDDVGTIGRSLLMAEVGLLICVLMGLVIIAQWIPIIIHGPCER
jgi:hypothetical protein